VKRAPGSVPRLRCASAIPLAGGDEGLHGEGDRIAGQDVGVLGVHEPGDDEDKERDRGGGPDARRVTTW
jgi:hypothetical protein